MSEQFRKILQIFYLKINTSSHADVYKKLLVEQFDQAEAQPVHILAITQKPNICNSLIRKKQTQKLQILYKNNDFASVFLFGFLLNIIKKGQMQYLTQFKKRVIDNLDIYYRQKQCQDSIKYKFIFHGIFQFCLYVISKQYQKQQIQKIFQSFYNNTFERRGLKKSQRQKYLTQSQIILSFILAKAGNFPSKRQVCEPTSDIYQLNSLQFCLNIQNNDKKQQWTIGQGQNHINITKQKNQYAVYQQQSTQKPIQQQQMNEAWINILNQSQQMSKQHMQKTSNIFSSLNLLELLSPRTKSIKSPKSVQVKYGIKKQKNIVDFF